MNYLGAGANSYERESSDSELHDANGYLGKAKGELIASRKKTVDNREGRKECCCAIGSTKKEMERGKEVEATGMHAGPRKK